jgi:TPR repeat protein
MHKRFSWLAALMLAVSLTACNQDNTAEIVAELRQKAEQGDSESQFNLGLLYYNGRAVEKDLGQALQWMRKAAEQHDGRAQSNLAVMYQKGEGAPADLAQAFQWALLSMVQGTPGANEVLEKLAGQASAEQQAAGKAAAEEWLTRNTPNLPEGGQLSIQLPGEAPPEGSVPMEALAPPLEPATAPPVPGM